MREIVDEEEKKEVMQQLFHEVRESKIDVVQRAKEIIQIEFMNVFIMFIIITSLQDNYITGRR